MKHYHLNPRDVLFFRDAKPMGGSSAGAGANWPLPGTLHSAVMSTFHDKWPEGSAHESAHQNWTKKEKEKGRDKTTLARFGALNTIGPFPCKENELMLPTPLDVAKGALASPVNRLGSDNLPSPLKYPVATLAPPTKDKPAPWTSVKDYAEYLRSGTWDVPTVRSEELYSVEQRPGVGINAETHAGEEGIFYQAEYLRLRNEVSLSFWGKAQAIKHAEKEGADLLSMLCEEEAPSGLIFGGQRGVSWLSRDDKKSASIEALLPPPSTETCCIKWVLLTPALFAQGWLPDWVDTSGSVALKNLLPRGDFPTRKAWREASKDAPPIGAELVAAHVGKPITTSGWKLNMTSDSSGGTPKATRLLVPASSVYYFECETPTQAQAQALVKQLHLKVKSQMLGEKGFGFGVCGTWKLQSI